MDLNLSGKVAIVTGASRGIGRAIAETLAAEGMEIAAAARSKDQLDDLAKSIKTEVYVLAVDLRSLTRRRGGRRHHGRFSSSMCWSTTPAPRTGNFFELTDADWEDGFALKFFGAMRLCRAAWKHLRPPGGVVNIIGIGGRTGSADLRLAGGSTPRSGCSPKRWPIAV